MISLAVVSPMQLLRNCFWGFIIYTYPEELFNKHPLCDFFKTFLKRYVGRAEHWIGLKNDGQKWKWANGNEFNRYVSGCFCIFPRLVTQENHFPSSHSSTWRLCFFMKQLSRSSGILERKAFILSFCSFYLLRIHSINASSHWISEKNNKRE